MCSMNLMAPRASHGDRRVRFQYRQLRASPSVPAEARKGQHMILGSDHIPGESAPYMGARPPRQISHLAGMPNAHSIFSARLRPSPEPK